MAREHEELDIRSVLPSRHPFSRTNKQIRVEFMPLFVSLSRFGAPTWLMARGPNMEYAVHVRDMHVWTKEQSKAKMLKTGPDIAIGLSLGYPFSPLRDRPVPRHAVVLREERAARV